MAGRESEWHEQWSLFQDDERSLFDEWIAPVTLADLRGKDVLEAGCGGGQHTCLLATVARSVTAVDLNTADLARERTAALSNVTVVEADIASMDLGRQFDVVICVGVIHHTDDPDRTFANLYDHLKPRGRLMVWTYSAEGNYLVRHLVEPSRRLLFRHLSRRALVAVAQVLTAAMYPVVHSVYRLRWFGFLPYYEYFENFRRLSFRRNVLNVFDKLNAPQTQFTTRDKCDQWFNSGLFAKNSISVRHHRRVSYSLSGVKKYG